MQTATYSDLRPLTRFGALDSYTENRAIGSAPRDEPRRPPSVPRDRPHQEHPRGQPFLPTIGLAASFAQRVWLEHSRPRGRTACILHRRSEPQPGSPGTLCRIGGNISGGPYSKSRRRRCPTLRAASGTSPNKPRTRYTSIQPRAPFAARSPVFAEKLRGWGVLFDGQADPVHFMDWVEKGATAYNVQSRMDLREPLYTAT